MEGPSARVGIGFSSTLLLGGDRDLVIAVFVTLLLGGDRDPVIAVFVNFITRRG